MELTQAIPLIALVIIGVVVFMLRKNRRVRVQASVQRAAPNVRAFFQRTGYAFPETRTADPEVQAKRWQQAYLTSLAGGGYKVHLVRSYQDLEVHWEHVTVRAAAGLVWSQSWWTPLAWNPSTPFHLTDRAALPGAPGNMQSNWTPGFANPVVTGDPDLDRRFVIYAPDDGQRVRAVLANPTLRQALLACAHVELRVTAEGVRFSDPLQKNAVAAMGGPAASMKYLANPGDAFEVTTPMHEHIAHLLFGAASLSR